MGGIANQGADTGGKETLGWLTVRGFSCTAAAGGMLGECWFMDAFFL